MASYCVTRTEEFFLSDLRAWTDCQDSPRRDITDVLATLRWWRWLHLKSGGASPYAVGRSVEPEAYWGENSGERFHRNKWAKYARGRHKPSERTLLNADRVFPGSAKEYRLAIWEILKRPPQSATSVAAMASKLEAAVARQVVLWLSDEERFSGESTDHLVGALECVASMDSLGGLMLVCYSALNAGQVKVARDLVRGIYRIAQLLGPELLMLGVARPFMDLLEQRFLCHAVYDGRRWFMSANAYMTTVAFLSFHSQGPSCAEPKAAMRAILDAGDPDLDCRAPLAPALVPANSVEWNNLGGARLRREATLGESPD